MLRLALVASSLAAALAPTGAHAVSVAMSGPAGARTVTVTGTDAAERVRVVGTGTGNPFAPPAVEVTVPAQDASQTGCTGPTFAAPDQTRKVTCPTGSGARLVVRLAGGGDGFDLGEPGGALASQGLAVDVDGGEGDDGLRVNTASLPPSGPQVTPVPVPPPVRLVGGFGNDVLASRSQAALSAGGQDDRLTGSVFDDDLVGGNGADTLDAGQGDDALAGGAGGDDVEGGPGFDGHSYQGSPPVVVTLDEQCDDGAAQDTREPTFVQRGDPGECQNNGVDRDRVRGVEALTGTDGADTLIGGPFAERLFGGEGADTLEGQSERDDLFGEEGADLLLARDEAPDGRLVCGALTAPVPGSEPAPTPGDRAVVDADDAVDRTCAEVERGGRQGPVAAPADPPPPSAPPAPPAIRPDLLTGAREPGAGAGGGLAGRPPQLRLISRRATPDRRGRAALRIACVYRARECVSTLRLEAPRTLSARRAGRTSRVRRGAVVGRASARIPWGRSASVRVPLTAALRRLLAAGPRRGIDLRLVVTARDGAQGARATPARLRATVRLGRRAR